MAWGQGSGMPFRCDDLLFVLERLESTLRDEVVCPVGVLSLLLMAGSVSGGCLDAWCRYSGICIPTGAAHGRMTTDELREYYCSPAA